MQVKTFSGPSASFVLAQIKEELGSDAVILSSRDIQKGGQRLHEVTVGIDQPIEKSNKTIPNINWEEWHKDWIKVKEHLYKLMQPSIQWEQLSPRHRVALEYLQREGADESIVMELYQRLISTPNSSFLEIFSEIIPIRPWSIEYWHKGIHGITGSFGSGKTSVALRMALSLRNENPSATISFINADCDRGSSRLVLKNWAELSEFGYAEARESVDIHKIIEESTEIDYLFIDFPSMSSKEDTLTKALDSLGVSDLDLSIHLVMSPHYSPIQNHYFISKYQNQKVGSIVWTKLDEAASYASLLNVAMAVGLPVSGLSYGSGLRDTFSPAYDSLLWKLIFKHQLPGQL